MIIFEDDRSWQDQANCLGVDPDLFFPERGASTKEAVEICSGCVVRLECLEYSLVNSVKFGIWGGLGERSRRKLKQQRAKIALGHSATSWPAGETTIADAETIDY